MSIEGLVHTARKTAIFAEPDEIRTVSKLCRAVQRRIPGSIIDNEDFGTRGCRHDRFDTHAEQVSRIPIDDRYRATHVSSQTQA